MRTCKNCKWYQECAGYFEDDLDLPKITLCSNFQDKRTDEEITRYILENYNYEKDEYIYINWNRTGIQYHEEDNLWYCDDVLIYPHQALAILEILEDK